ncbi:MAG: acyl-CoA dehydrogenase [Candidatus Latescibacterota bacterium]|jgi:acyl-CoA dehydrogenase|nr:MAG: acyl-CoA dehydrogenase [Candidatus Latescibacterota bacterium]
MLDFELSEEQRMLVEAVRKFGKTEIAPYIRKIDTDQKLPQRVISGLADLGLLGMSVSQEYGGADADPVTVGLVAEELAKADITCATPTFFLVQAAWGHIFNKYGTKKAKEAILPKVTKGEAFIGIASTEPDTGSDVANMKTNAKKKGGGYVVNGEKMFISGVGEIQNVLPAGGGYVMLAKTEPDKGAKGISLFYMPIKGTKGVTPTLLDDWGRRGISTGGFAMEDVEIPAEYLIGPENKGFFLAMEGFEYARAIIGMVCCGAAMASLDHAMEYLKIRKAFGRPIGTFEGVQFKLAEHYTRMDALRLLALRALWQYGREMKTGEGRFLTALYCAESKLLAPESAFDAINDAIHWFGAFGYTVECPLELALKGVRSYYWAEGTREVMRTIVGRELMGKEYVVTR